MELETKNAGSPVQPDAAGFKPAMESLNRTLESLQSLLQTKSKPDNLDQEQISRIANEAANKAIEAQLAARMTKFEAELHELKMRPMRPGQNANDNAPSAANDNTEYKSQWLNWVRSGNETKLREYEQKNGLSTEQAQAASFLLPSEIAEMIDVELRLYSPVREYARVVTISGSSLQIPLERLGQRARWTNSERDAPVTQPTDKFGFLEIRAEQLEAKVEVTDIMLQDSRINLESWIADKVSAQFGVEEGIAFISGSGAGQPQGFLSYRNTPSSAERNG